jgi:hypothetical protein
MGKFKPCPMLAAIDVETHTLVSGSTKWWTRGQFGFLTTIKEEDLASLRVVQLGWAIGEANGPPDVHDYVVKPEGFCISTDATKKHRIHHEYAVSHGATLPDVLQTMVEAVLDCCARGGRIVARHLEFDAGIISCELDRTGLVQLKTPWRNAVKSGICTMDPDIACWVRDMIGIRDIPRSIPMRLIDMVKALIIDSETLCRNHHSAGNDALMHYRLCRELYMRCEAYVVSSTTCPGNRKRRSLKDKT